MNNIILQIGSHIGNTINDPIFHSLQKEDVLILVEPVPWLFEQLQENYKKRTDIQHVHFINKAVSDRVGEIVLTVPSMENDFSKLPYWATQIASVNENHARAHQIGLITEKITVPTITINAIIEEYDIQSIKLLHTDTEGHDYDILMSYDFCIKPKRILFEHMHMDGFKTIGTKFFTLVKRLMALGYQVDIENVTQREDTECLLV